jgi:hypothetical protein
VRLERALPADPVRPVWKTSSSLVYAGGLVALLATVALLGILQDEHGTWALVGWSALATVAALALAVVLERADRAVAAGVAATLAVVFLAVLTAAVLDGVGALDAEISDYQPATLLVEAVTIAAALAAVARFRSPLPLLPAAVAFWVAVADLGELVSWDDAAKVLSILAGALLVVAGLALDRRGHPAFAFWPHAVGGLALGLGVVALVHGDLGWALVGLLSLVYVAAAYVLGRSSYAVLGALGILATTTAWVVDPLGLLGNVIPFFPASESDRLEAWQIALAYVAAGLFIGLLGVVGRVTRLRAHEPPAAVEPL